MKKNIAISIFVIALLYYPFVEVILQEYRRKQPAFNNFMFFLYLTQSLIPLVLTIFATSLLAFNK
jgi:magnesium-transporting ATPase (P-type)